MPRLIVSPVTLPSLSRNGCATATREGSAPPRQAKLTNISPGRKRPWSSRRTRWLRSSASSSRDVVDFASPVTTASSVKDTGSAACTTSESRRAARSTACVPLGLLIGALPVRPRCLYRCRAIPLYGTKFYDVEVFVNRMPRYEILSSDALGVLDKGWRRIVSEVGVQFAKPGAVALFAQAGQRVDGEVVYLDPEFVLEQIAKVPREFDIQARNPANTAHIGGDHMVFGAVYGAPFVRQGSVRREATLADFHNLCKLSQAFPQLDSAGGVICEPNDAPLDSRHLDMVQALGTLTDKIYMGNVVSGPNAADTIAMTEILFGGGAGRAAGRASIERTPAVVSLVNCNSPLRWDDRMLDAQFEYCAANQPVVLTPFLLMGAGARGICGCSLPNADGRPGPRPSAPPEPPVGLLPPARPPRHYGLPF